MTPTPYHRTAAYVDAVFAKVGDWRPARLRRFLGVRPGERWTKLALQYAAANEITARLFPR